MRVAIIGQQDFGKATLEAFLARGDDVAAVFCAPEKGRPDPLRLAGEAAGIPTHQFPRLTDPEAQEALRAANADIGIMAYVTQFVPQDFCNVPKFGTIQFHPSLLPAAPRRLVNELVDHPRPIGDRLQHLPPDRRPR